MPALTSAMVAVVARLRIRGGSNLTKSSLLASAESELAENELAKSCSIFDSTLAGVTTGWPALATVAVLELATSALTMVAALELDADEEPSTKEEKESYWRKRLEAVETEALEAVQWALEAWHEAAPHVLHWFQVSTEEQQRKVLELAAQCVFLQGIGSVSDGFASTTLSTKAFAVGRLTVRANASKQRRFSSRTRSARPSRV